MREETRLALILLTAMAVTAVVTSAVLDDPRQPLSRGASNIAGVIAYWVLLKWTVWRKVVPP